jgi:hypothetical protein
MHENLCKSGLRSPRSINAALLNFGSPIYIFGPFLVTGTKALPDLNFPDLTRLKITRFNHVDRPSTPTFPHLRLSSLGLSFFLDTPGKCFPGECPQKVRDNAVFPKSLSSWGAEGCQVTGSSGDNKSTAIRAGVWTTSHRPVST